MTCITENTDCNQYPPSAIYSIAGDGVRLTTLECIFVLFAFGMGAIAKNAELAPRRLDKVEKEERNSLLGECVEQLIGTALNKILYVGADEWEAFAGRLCKAYEEATTCRHVQQHWRMLASWLTYLQ